MRLLCFAAVAMLLTPACDRAASNVSGGPVVSKDVPSPTLLAAIRKNAHQEIDFADHFSASYVDCGTGCGSYWFVDRQSGAVIAAPGNAPDGQMVWDMKTRPNSDMVVVIYGPQDGLPGPGCSEERFRWTGREFEQSSQPRKVLCPG